MSFLQIIRKLLKSWQLTHHGNVKAGLGIKYPDLANVQLLKGDNLKGTLLVEVRQELVC